MTLDIPEGALSKLGMCWLHFRVRIKTQVLVHVLHSRGGGRWLSEEESHGLDVILRMGAAWGAGT